MLQESRSKWEAARSFMIALQEELDWQVYSLYKLHSEDLRAPEMDVPALKLGERAFEIVLARRVEAGEASGEWFKRHGSTPITEIPAHWPDSYKAVVQKRIDVIETSRAIGMVERPEYKRRWATEGWDVLQERALKSWLLDRIENRDHWFDENGQPAILALHQLTDALSHDEDFVSVAEIYAPHKELATVVSELLADEHVPFLAALRYKPAALKKRADWEHVWDLQRQEDDATEESEKRKIRDSIPVPPKYTSADFLKASYWKARGKLDVPKERFISYATGAISGTPTLFGWAGWDHREQAQALSTYFTNHDELSAEELTPLLAGLLELQPWLTQWHNEFDGLYGGSPAAFFEGYRSAKQGEHGLTDDDLRAWRPRPPSAGLARQPRADQSGVSSPLLRGEDTPQPRTASGSAAGTRSGGPSSRPSTTASPPVAYRSARTLRTVRHSPHTRTDCPTRTVTAAISATSAPARRSGAFSSAQIVFPIPPRRGLTPQRCVSASTISRPRPSMSSGPGDRISGRPSPRRSPPVGASRPPWSARFARPPAGHSAHARTARWSAVPRGQAPRSAKPPRPRPNPPAPHAAPLVLSAHCADGGTAGMRLRSVQTQQPPVGR